MRITARRHLLLASLLALVLLDLLALASFVFNQWFAVPVWQAWGLAASFALPVTMLALPVIDRLLASLESDENDRFSGDKIPGAGQ